MPNLSRSAKGHHKLEAEKRNPRVTPGSLYPRAGPSVRCSFGTDHCTCKIKWSYGNPCTFFIAASASDRSSNETNPNPLHSPVSWSLPT